MKKITLFIVMLTAFAANIISQPCLPDGIIFSNQSMIDNFQTNYPNCNIVEGDVRIHGNDIINLDGLNSITGIDGYLEIRINPNLTELAGLSNLSYIGDYLLISENPLLISFIGLNSLETIGGYLGVEMNDQITNFEGFESLTTIAGYFDITFNGNLQNFIGINNLSSIGEDLSINANYSLINLFGLNNITSDVTHIVLWGNTLLTDITSLQNINSISETLLIRNNNVLDNLSGLETINLEQMQYLTIKKNEQLSECEIQNICNYLSASTGTIEIYENATGCNSQEEVQIACQVGITEFDNKKPTIYPNPTKNILNINCNGIQIQELRIYDEVGVEVLYKNIDFEVIDVAFLKSGLYLLELSSNEIKIRKKLIIE